MRLATSADGRPLLVVGSGGDAAVVDVLASLAAAGPGASAVAQALVRSAETGWAGAIEGWATLQPSLDALLRAVDQEDARVVAAPLAQTPLGPPLVPPALLCGGQNYADHLDEMPPPPLTRAQRGGPSAFIKLPQTVVGHGTAIEHPSAITEKLDFEVELAVVMGRPGRAIAAASALDHVFGYSILNDMTLRDRQCRFRPDGVVIHDSGVPKNFDGAAPLGPVIVTADELSDPQALEIRSVLNGVVRQRDTTANMVDSVADYIAYLSRFVTLRPGFVIATGTCGGTGWGMDPELGGTRPVDAVGRAFLQPGDHIECVIEGIGTLANPIVVGAGA